MTDDKWIETPHSYLNLSRSKQVIDRSTTPKKVFNDWKRGFSGTLHYYDLSNNKKVKAILIYKHFTFSI